MPKCGFCGRANDDQSRFCIDCGKPVVAGGARVISMGAIAKPAEARSSSGSGGSDPDRGSAPRAVPKTRVAGDAQPKGGALKQCLRCKAMFEPAFPFCPQCGQRVEGESPPAGTAVFSAKGTGAGPKLSLLGETGDVKQTFTIDGGEATVGRNDGDLRFPDDVYMSPMHATLALRDGQIFVRDLGSRNGTWLFIDGPYRLQDGDTILVGSQLIRFRRLGYPGPHPPEADQTRRLGSLTPSADIAVLAQLRADGSARDMMHLSPARSLKLGRDHGDWVFPYDKTMSGRHAEVRSEDLEFIVLDDGSRNGVAVAVRGEKQVKTGQRLLLGDQTLRVESL